MKKIFILPLVLLTAFACKHNKTENTAPQQDSIPAAVTNNSEFSYHPETTKLTWTAYKTPDKIGVKGTFNEIEVENTKVSPIKEEVLSGATFKINSISVNSGDEMRDNQIKTLFFESMVSPEITGSFGTLNKGIAPITLKMNGKEITKDFNYTFSNNEIIITGVIDIISDFGIEKGFNLLHDACKVLHQEKTWTDVSIEVITTL